MMSKTQKFSLFFLTLLFFYPIYLNASSIILPKESGTFAVTPARKELSIKAGEFKNFELRLANHLGQTQDFSLQVRDVLAGGGNQGFIFASSSAGYTLSQIVNFSSTKVTLKNGEEKVIPIKINIPSNWPAQSVAGLIEISPIKDFGNTSTKVKTGAGIFVLVRVDGEAKEKGSLEKFDLIGSRLASMLSQIRFQIAYKNEGNVHLNPYGAIYLKNVFGQIISKNFVDPWFVLPQSVRLREVDLSRSLWPGIYSAELQLNLGYKNQIVNNSFYFLVVPNWWQGLIIVFVVLLILKIVLKLRERNVK